MKGTTLKKGYPLAHGVRMSSPYSSSSIANAGISSATCNRKTVPVDRCAILYDEEDCGGWAFEVPQGYSELRTLVLTGPKKNDAESVLVRQGCRFIGMVSYHHNHLWPDLLMAFFCQATTTKADEASGSAETL